MRITRWRWVKIQLTKATTRTPWLALAVEDSIRSAVDRRPAASSVRQTLAATWASVWHAVRCGRG